MTPLCVNTSRIIRICIHTNEQRFSGFSPVLSDEPWLGWGSPEKKTNRHPKADEATRTAHAEKIIGYKKEKKPIVYLDESGFAADMLRTHGYSPQGERCFGTHDGHKKGRTNALGAWLNGLLLTAC